MPNNRSVGPAKALEQTVIPAALCDGPSQVPAVAFEDDAGVVVEVADGAQVEAHDSPEPMRHQQLLDPRQLGEGPLRAAVADQASGGLEDLRSTTKGGEPQKQLVLGRAQGRARQQLFEGDEVTRSQSLAHAGLDR